MGLSLKISFFLFSTILFVASCNQPKSKSYLASENLKGKIKLLKESFYSAEDKDGKIEKGKIIFTALYKIDNSGNKTEWIEWDPDGKMRWKAESVYDGQNREIECKGHKENGDLDWRSHYKYNADGNRIEEEEFNPDGRKNFRIVFKYNDLGVRTERYFYTAEGDLYSKSTYLFDDKGNIAEECAFAPDGVMKAKTEYRYANFDKAGNWLAQAQYANSTIVVICEREIEYY